ncbi:MAG: hypothetical protein P8N92_08755 [Burkholderiales bacterium]|nr:hypothetical protein [Burkholderiales bacterium]
MTLQLDSLHYSLPSADVRKKYAIDILEGYWSENEELVGQLPVPSTQSFSNEVPPHMSIVMMPDWAKDCGVEGGILVPTQWCDHWDRVPWFDVIWWMANGWAERVWEESIGCAHSYSVSLKGWDHRLWERAWVNRIAMFLRRWVANRAGRPESIIFGDLPKGELIITHDVDAIRKTGVIRLKQAVFNFFNSARLLMSGQVKLACRKLLAAFRFLVLPDDYMGISSLIDIEKKFGVRSTFLFYAGKIGWRRSIKSILIDPSYDVGSQELKMLIQHMQNGGWQIGLHPSAIAWSDSDEIAKQRVRLEDITHQSIGIVRQHWLRFSWKDTWSVQREAGLNSDMTLGFNDRPGFRNSAALRMQVISGSGEKLKFKSTPMLLMDSHLYDYSNFSDYQRVKCMEHYLDEIKLVGGIGSIIWHAHVLGKDYGWRNGYLSLLSYWCKDKF